MALVDLVLGLIAFAIVVTIPGYFVTLALFPKKQEIDNIERLTFSFVFSITFLPLLVLVENQLLGIAINFFTVLSSLLLMIIVAILVYLIRTQKLAVPEAVYKALPKVAPEESVEIIPKFK